MISSVSLRVRGWSMVQSLWRIRMAPSQRCCMGTWSVRTIHHLSYRGVAVPPFRAHSRSLYGHQRIIKFTYAWRHAAPCHLFTAGSWTDDLLSLMASLSTILNHSPDYELDGGMETRKWKQGPRSFQRRKFLIASWALGPKFLKNQNITNGFEPGLILKARGNSYGSFRIGKS